MASASFFHYPKANYVLDDQATPRRSAAAGGGARRGRGGGGGRHGGRPRGAAGAAGRGGGAAPAVGPVRAHAVRRRVARRRVLHCSAAGDRVTELRLPGKSLRGAVPVGTVGNLTALRTLSLRTNAISGGVPADIGGCVQLRSLNLSGNRLAGRLPEGLFSLALLEKVDLSGNRLTGGVSPEFSRLASLTTLNLDRNGFNGTLPGNLMLPKLAQFNVSYNGQLGGAVPASLTGMPASAFLGTALCGGPLAPCANPSPPSPGGSKGVREEEEDRRERDAMKNAIAG
ncbi:probable inactive receptor kinase RLK902 [Oryza glaberrima]|uniref:probable inactive receptor kinase RLK902 n=1 Tax=Oryza glaberrima TaxID=4538 RepID=UPI00224C40BC|nr:probable inactive receptor kinase RLK902 [Oryza glaberrima]